MKQTNDTFMSKNVRGHKVIMTRHFLERAEQRLSYLGIRFSSSAEYHALAMDFVVNALINRFMFRYMENLFKCKSNRLEVLVKDTRTDMVFVFAIKPKRNEIYCVTFGTEKEKKWVNSHDLSRVCWIYDNAFVFSTANGNVTWY